MRHPWHRTAGKHKPNHRNIQVSVYVRAGWSCECCGSGWNLTKDHVIPRAWGGSNALYNKQLLCASCNQRKADTAICFSPREDVQNYVEEFIKNNEKYRTRIDPTTLYQVPRQLTLF